MSWSLSGFCLNYEYISDFYAAFRVKIIHLSSDTFKSQTLFSKRGAASVESLTGMNKIAACFSIPGLVCLEHRLSIDILEIQP